MGRAAIGLAIALVAIAACGGATGPPTITITGSDCIYDGPSELEAGLVTFTVVNESAEEVEAVFLELLDGGTAEEHRQSPHPTAPGIGREVVTHGSVASTSHVRALPGGTIESGFAFSEGEIVIECVAFKDQWTRDDWREAAVLTVTG